LRQTKGQLRRERHDQGELVVVGHPSPDKEMPADLLEAKPAVPVLNKLALVEGDGPADKPTLRIPQDLVDTWWEHEKFNGDSRRSWRSWRRSGGKPSCRRGPAS
jgi:hypothetical protein